MNYYEALEKFEKLPRYLTTHDLLELIRYIERNYIGEEEE